MEPCKPVKPCGLAATEAQQQPPHCGSAEGQYTSAWLQAPSVPRKVSLSRRTSAPIRNVASSRTSKQVMCRRDVPKADKATQTPTSCKGLWKEWQPEDKKKKSSNRQDQLWWQASRATSATESCPQALQHRAPSPAKEAVTPQDRKSMSSQCMNQYEEGEEQDEAELEENVAPSAACAPKSSVIPKPLTKKRVIKLRPRKTTRNSRIPRQRIECKAANMTRKQGKAFSSVSSLLPGADTKLPSPEVAAEKLGINRTSQEAAEELACAGAEKARTMDFSDLLDIITDHECSTQTTSSEKNDSISFDSADIKGILLLNILLKLAELAALPRRTLFRIISYYQQMLRDYTGQEVRADGDFLKRGRKKPHKIRKERIYPNPTFVSRARVPARKKRTVASDVEHLKDSPYAQVPIFPLISEEKVTTRAKRKKGWQKVSRRRNKLESHTWVQEERETSNTCVCEDTTRTSFHQAAAPKCSAPCRKQRRSPDINSECLNTQCHLTTGCVGTTQARGSVKRGWKTSPFVVRGQQLGQD